MTEGIGLHHTADPTCPLCEAKLQSAHPFMQNWFHGIKSRYINTHISWAYRGKEDQEAAFTAGKSRDHFPESPHNRLNPETQLPESLALDLFQEDEDGNARFSPKFYLMIAMENKANKVPIAWGGDFRTLGDRDHYQYVPPSITVNSN